MSAVATPMTLADVWDTILAPKFTRFREVLVRGAEPHGNRALETWTPPPNARAIDVGCGFGESTFDLARYAGPSAIVTGVDIARSFIEIARADARARGSTHVGFVVADMEDYAPREPVDYVFSRFGTMFFERPVAAFRKVHAAMKPGAELVMTTWRPLNENPWLAVAKAVAREWLPAPGPDAISCGPGPFSLSDPNVVRDVLSRAGFHSVTLVPSEGSTLIGRTLEAAIEFQLAIGPAGEIVREAGEAATAVLPELRRGMARALESSVRDDGVFMPSSAWIVRALA